MMIEKVALWFEIINIFFHQNVKVYFKALFSYLKTQSDFVFSSLFGIFFIFLASDNAVSCTLWKNELR